MYVPLYVPARYVQLFSGICTVELIVFQCMPSYIENVAALDGVMLLLTSSANRPDFVITANTGDPWE